MDLAGVFSGVIDSTTGALLISGFFSIMMLPLLSTAVSTGNEVDCPLVPLVSLSPLLVVFNVTMMAGVFLTTFRLRQTEE